MSRNKKNWDHLVDLRGQYIPLGQKGGVGSKGLKGQKGLDGDGVKGSKGEKGQEGLAGVKGDQGPAGTAIAAGVDTDVQFNVGGQLAAGSNGTFQYNDGVSRLSVENLSVLDEISLSTDTRNAQVNIQAASVMGASYNLFLPPTQANGVSVIENDGLGNLEWTDEIDSGTF
jgi:hypothetical protein